MISLVIGTNSVRSLTAKVAQVYADALDSAGVDYRVADLRDLPSAFLHNDMYAHRTDDFDAWQREYLVGAEKFMFLLPEYNGSYPGILKLVMDAADYQSAWAGKKAMLCGVSAGRAGNLRGMDHMTNVLNYLKINVHPNKLPISSIGSLMTDGALTDEDTINLIKEQVDQLIAF